MRAEPVPALEYQPRYHFAEGEELVRASGVIVCTLTHRRQTWGGKFTYRTTGHHFYESFAAASQEAEIQRINGSTLIVREVPAIKLESAESSAVVIQPGMRDPFANWEQREDRRDALLLGSSFERLLRHFYLTNDVTILAPTSGLPEIRTEPPLQSWRSYARGTDYLLGWMNAASEARVPDGVVRLVGLIDGGESTRADHGSQKDVSET